MNPCSISRITAVLIACSLCPASSVADDAPDELTRARVAFEKEFEFSTRPIRDRYISRLEAMKRSLGSRGDARGAAAVQDEIDRVNAMGSEPSNVGKFAGVWKLEYTNGISRRYSISADGIVTYDEMGGKPVTPPVRGKLALKGNDFLIDWGDGSLERLKISAKNLMIDHFNPKTTYPGGQPTALGVGVNVSSR